MGRRLGHLLSRLVLERRRLLELSISHLELRRNAYGIWPRDPAALAGALALARRLPAHAHRKPGAAGRDERETQSGDAPFHKGGVTSRTKDDGKNHGHDRELSDLDAEVEPKERHRHLGAGEIELRQGGGEPEAMDQAERKGNAPALRGV